VPYDTPGANVTNGYNPALPFYGAKDYYSIQPDCNLAVQQNYIQAGSSFPNWLATNNNLVDIRYAYVGCCMDNASNFCSYFNTTTLGSTPWPDPTQVDTNVLWTNSSISGTYVMFTTEALYYAQSGYFVTIVMIQWSNVFACKSRKVKIALFR
jgi:sodium/potassium-transporting ATPase subunit alpha